jgi:large subunit ribosomal protein L2
MWATLRAAAVQQQQVVGRTTRALHTQISAQSPLLSIVARSAVASPVAAIASSSFAQLGVARRSKHTKSQQELDGEAAGIIHRPNPKTPGLRHVVRLRHDHLWRGKPVRSLTIGKTRCGGRNNTGRMVLESRGGGNKRLYRFIDFKRSAVFDEQAIVQRIEYDPNRNAHIALVQYNNGVMSYIIAPDHLKAGDSVLSSRTQEIDLKPGNCMPLLNVPIGTVVHNVELHPGKGGQLARAAGTSCTLVDKNGKPGYGLVELASKEQRYIPLACMASIGVVSNPLHKLIKLGKAGRARWAGRRSHVRGCAMNPVDHPMGGGHSAKGRQPCSPSGVLSKGYKTRRKNKKNLLIVVPRGGIQKGAGGQFGGV